MSTVDVMTHLQACWSEISGIQRAFLYEPEQVVQESDLYAVYPVQLGRMRTPTPSISAGQYYVEREYIYRVLIAPLTKASMDSLDEGAYVDELGVAFVDSPIDYFLTNNHNRLQSSTLSEVKYLERDLTIVDSGISSHVGPGGALYRSIDYTFVIVERRFPTVPRLS